MRGSKPSPRMTFIRETNRDHGEPSSHYVRFATRISFGLACPLRLQAITDLIRPEPLKANQGAIETRQIILCDLAYGL